MDNNHTDDFVLVLEDRKEVKHEAEVGKLSVVSNIDEKGNSRQLLPKKPPFVQCYAHALWQPLPPMPKKSICR